MHSMESDEGFYHHERKVVTMKGKKKVILVMTLVLSFVFSTSVVYASFSEVTADIGSVHIRFRNEIYSGKLSAYAETHSSDQTTQTYVTATFYYFDPVNRTYGQIEQSQGNNGASQVNVGPSTLPYITEYYYQVVSNHIATHGGVTVPCYNLTTFEP